MLNNLFTQFIAVSHLQRNWVKSIFLEFNYFSKCAFINFIIPAPKIFTSYIESEHIKKII